MTHLLHMLRRWSGVLVPTGLAVVVIVLAGRVFTAPVVFPDTFGYLAAGMFNPVVGGFRTPTYGWLLTLALRLQIPMLPVILQCILWIACIAGSALLTWRLTRSVVKGALAGAGMVFLEVVLMHHLPANWYYLTDAPYAALLTLGLVFMLLGMSQVQNKTEWVGALLIGSANLIRPLLAGSLTGSVATIVIARATGGNVLSRRVGISLALLWAPVLVLCMVNGLAYGSFSSSSQSGMFLMLTAMELAEPGDTVFHDPELNRAFHAVITQKKAPADHLGTDPYSINTAPDWHALSSFYGSIVGEMPVSEMRFSVGRLSSLVTLRLALLHPVAYARVTGKQFLFLLVPDNVMRHYWWPKDPLIMASQQHDRWMDLYRITGGPPPVRVPELRAPDHRIVEWLDTAYLGIRLGKTAGPKSLALFSALGLLCVVQGVRLARARDHTRLIGLAILLLLLLNTVAHAGAQSLVTLVADARYRIPGLLTAELALLLTLLTLRRNPAD